MSIVFFLSIFTAFLYFCAFYLLSPERNPKYKTLMEHKNAPTDEALQLTAVVFNAVAMVLTVVLVATVPFLRAMGAIAMAGLVVRFFYRKYFSGAPRTNFVPVRDTPRSKGHAGYHTEEDGQAFDPKRGNGGGTSQ